MAAASDAPSSTRRRTYSCFQRAGDAFLDSDCERGERGEILVCIDAVQFVFEADDGLRIVESALDAESIACLPQ
jgi:hypothetical protein